MRTGLVALALALSSPALAANRVSHSDPVTVAAQQPTDAAVPHAHGRAMVVQDVFSTPDGQYVVVLRTETRPMRFLPIWVGNSEALAIRLRLDRQTPPRPLTLNLLESVLKSGHIQVLAVRIDGQKNGVFLSHIILRQNGRTWPLDARPSDAIGLALGRHAPIWVKNSILEAAGFSASDLKKGMTKPGQTSGYEATL